ncbi:hypothetical protein [Kitasatospora sp. NPDC088346]|uniref:hypothetical protein n=1 Tax=Kitasatospora sp. NPDC088346 TaxID=3364073 RepID=UPI0038215CF6
MNVSTDPAWPTWVGTTVALANGLTGTVRMAQRRYATDRLWAVDTRGTMHEIGRDHIPRPRDPRQPRLPTARTPRPLTRGAPRPVPTSAAPRPRTPDGTAAYLRCYPFDTWGMTAHRHLVEDYAHYLDLPTPALYFDNGRRTRCPEFDRLLHSVTTGRHGIVLIPGPWVFALHPDAAEQRRRLLTDRACRVVELPRPPW